LAKPISGWRSQEKHLRTGRSFWLLPRFGLPDTAKEKPQEGIVEAVGTGRILDNGTKIPMELKVGDKILYAKYAGNEFKLDEIEYLIVSEKDVLAVVSSNGKKK